nr:T9SS type A sorting domain-containing protein [uncultured Pedobacter sp.]
MNKKLLYFFSASISLIVLSNSSFGQTAASATWALSTDKTVATIGSINATGQVLGELTDRTYSANIEYLTGGFQRLTSTSVYTATSTATPPVTSPSIPFVTGGNPDLTHFSEFKVTSQASTYTKINDFQITAFGGGTGNCRLIVFYSLDGFATAGIPMPSAGTYNSISYLAADATNAVVLLNTSTGGKVSTSTPATATLEDATLKFTGINKVLAPTETFTVRVYPFLSSASTTSARYFISQKAVISATTASTPSLLPLDFLSFTAKSDAFGKTVSLNWSTTNEVNTKNFEIQRRTDGSDFVTIGTLASKNVAGTHNYSFTDNSAVSGNSYYRIVQYDNDGASTISKIQAVTTNTSAGLSIYPNPTASILSISHSLAEAGANAKVIGMDGKTVLQQALGLNSTETKLDVSQLTPGNYLLILDNRDQKSSLKFVKQ